MKLLECLALVLVLTGAGPPAAAGGPDAWLFLDRWLVADEPVDDRYTLGVGPLAAVEPAVPAVRLESTFAEKDRPALDGLPAAWRLLSLKARATSRLWAGTLSEDAEFLGYESPELADVAAADAAGPRLLRLGVVGTWGRVESGVRFESVSPGLEKVTGPGVKPDQERVEAWLALRLGPLSLQTVLDERHDNVLDDPRRASTTWTEHGVTARWTLPAGSLVSLALTRGEAQHAAPRRGPAPGRGSPAADVDSVVATVYHYGGPAWDLSLSSTYTASATVGRPVRETTALSHDASASFHPTPAIAVVPALGVYEETPTGAGAGVRGVSASMSISVAPLAGPLDLWLYGGFTRNQTTDDAYDGQSLDVSASLTWHLRRSPPTASLAFEVGYDGSVDAAARGTGYEELRGLVTLRIAAF